MTPQEAIQRIKTHNEIHSRKEHFAVKITKALQMAVEALENQQWIPVTERLPEPYVDVLVIRNGKIAIDHHEEDGWFAHDFKGKRATHWIPLPAPPEEI